MSSVARSAPVQAWEKLLRSALVGGVIGCVRKCVGVSNEIITTYSTGARNTNAMSSPVTSRAQNRVRRSRAACRRCSVVAGRRQASGMWPS